MNFNIGQKIVCVNDDWTHLYKHLVPNLPHKGRLYHVRGTDPTGVHDEGGGYIWLCEITNPRPFRGSGEPSFAERCFRPVIERKTSIACFTSMLTPQPTLVE